MIARGIVTAQLNYGNALLHDMLANNLNRMHLIQNMLARTACQTLRSADTTALHWLPKRQNMTYKIVLITREARLTYPPGMAAEQLHSITVITLFRQILLTVLWMLLAFSAFTSSSAIAERPENTGK